MIKLFFVDIDRVVHEQEFQSWKFPGGEVGVKLSEESIFLAKNATSETGFCIYWKFENNEEFMIVANLQDALLKFHNLVSLLMPYIPYARQDRVCHPGESFALSTFATMLNSLNFDSVCVFDPHSKASSSLIKNLDVIPQYICAADLPKYDYLIAPDAGASVKINLHRQVNDIENPTKVIVMDKERVNGKVIHKVPDNLPDLTHARICVIDDICDGGATFLSITEVLPPMFHKPDLYVTHGIFSKGVDSLLEKYGTIYTSNLMNQSVKGRVVELLASK